MEKLKCFKAYDIRGKVPEEFNQELAYHVGNAYANIIKPNIVIVGYDARLDSAMFAQAVINGLVDNKVRVINIGLCGTEEVYFHTFNRMNDGVDGGMMITASHNPKGYNGIKMVKSNSRPLMQDDLNKIHDFVVATYCNNDIDHKRNDDYKQFSTDSCHEYYSIDQNKDQYIFHLMSYLDIHQLKSLKIVVNPGNGPAGIIIKMLEKYLPFNFVYIHEKIDGNFPNGVPNPMIVENRYATSNAVIKHNADLGIAWDGDFDRCFFFDENGQFVESNYIIGLLATHLLNKANNDPDSKKIVHDAKLIWYVLDKVRDKNGISVISRSGHSFIKEKMRQENALYGGETSAHHYFRDFAYCDSGMIAWLLIAELLCNNDSSNNAPITLSSLVQDGVDGYPSSGEINFTVSDVNSSINAVAEHFTKQNAIIEYIDGISVQFEDWRFNLRGSNTEPLLRLNLETRGCNLSIDKLLSQIKDII